MKGPIGFLNARSYALSARGYSKPKYFKRDLVPLCWLRLRLLKHPVSVECCKSHVRFCCLLKWLSGVPSNWGATKNYVEWSRAHFSIWETFSKKLENHSVSTIFLPFIVWMNCSSALKMFPNSRTSKVFLNH